MTNKDIEKQLRQSFNKITPDVLDTILQECEVQNNMTNVDVKENKRQPRSFRRYAIAIMACFAFIACIGLFFSNNTSPSIITLDVNPGIEIHLNDDNQTIEEVKAVNDDALIVLEGLDLKNQKIDDGVYAILDSMLEKGYISNDKNSILLSIDCDDEVFNTLKDNLSTYIDAYLNSKDIEVSLLSQAIINDDLDNDNHKLTAGKAQLIAKLMAANPLFEYDDLSELNINDLNLLLTNPKLDIDDIEIEGSASEGLYVGRDMAKDNALAHLNINESLVSKLDVELDLEDGLMVYEVEFDYNNQEYEILVNASTGEVLTNEIEIEDIDDDDDLDDDVDDDDEVIVGDFIDKNVAIETALNHAGLNLDQVRELEAELDRENNLVIYEVEFKYDGYEYDYDIDATSGAIIKNDKELDD